MKHGDVYLRWDAERFAVIRKVLNEFKWLVREDAAEIEQLTGYVTRRLSGQSKSAVEKEFIGLYPAKREV